MNPAFIRDRHHVCRLPSGLHALVRARWETRFWTFFGLLPNYRLADFVIESCESPTDQEKAEVRRQLLERGPMGD